MYSLPNLEPVGSSMFGSNCCFLTCIQVSQEVGKVVWYSYLFLSEFSTVFCDSHSQRLQHRVSEAISLLGIYPVQFSCSVVPNSLQTHESQHARPPCPSPTPGVHSNSCPLSRWYHLAISSSVVPFSSCLQYFPESGSFQMSQLFTSSGQSTGASASASMLSMNIQDWFPLGWTGWIFLQSKGLSIYPDKTVIKKGTCTQMFIATLCPTAKIWKQPICPSPDEWINMWYKCTMQY